MEEVKNYGISLGYDHIGYRLECGDNTFHTDIFRDMVRLVQEKANEAPEDHRVKLLVESTARDVLINLGYIGRLAKIVRERNNRVLESSK